MLALATLSAPMSSSDESRGFEPGIFSLVSRVARAMVQGQAARSEARIGAFIDENGGRLTDDIERQIMLGHISGRF